MRISVPALLVLALVCASCSSRYADDDAGPTRGAPLVNRKADIPPKAGQVKSASSPKIRPVQLPRVGPNLARPATKPTQKSIATSRVPLPRPRPKADVARPPAPPAELVCLRYAIALLDCKVVLLPFERARDYQARYLVCLKDHNFADEPAVCRNSVVSPDEASRRIREHRSSGMPLLWRWGTLGAPANASAPLAYHGTDRIPFK